MATSLEDTQNLLRQAHQRGDRENATKLIAKIAQMRTAEAEPELPEGDMVDMVAEPAKAIASSLAGSALGGTSGILSGIYEGFKEGDPEAGMEAGAEVSQDIQQDFAESGAPETQAGQKGLETMGDLFENIADFGNYAISDGVGLIKYLATMGDKEAMDKTIADVREKGISKTLGDDTFEATGDPLWSTLAEMSPALMETVAGVNLMRGKPMQTVSEAGESIAEPRRLNPEVNPVTRIANRSELKQKIAEDIRAGSQDAGVAKYMLDGAGKLAGDPRAKEAIRQGYSPSVISAIKGAPEADRQRMLEMVDIMRKGKTNARYAMDNRPSDVAGASLMERIRHVKKVNKDSGKELDDVAKNLRGSYADFNPAMRNFFQSLDDMGISIKGRNNVDYDESILQGLDDPQRAINNMVKRLWDARERGAVPDAYDMHQLKKFIDENVTYGGKGAEGLKGKTERVLKKLRSDIDTALDDTFPEYDRVNSTYADTRTAIDAIQDTAGKKMNLDGANAEKATGTLLRRLMSNYSNRVQLYDALVGLDDVGRRYGGVFDDDLKTQILFADELDTLHGAVARTSLAGEVGKGTKQTLRELSLGELPVEAGARAINYARDIGEEQAFDSLDALLRNQ